VHLFNEDVFSQSACNEKIMCLKIQILVIAGRLFKNDAKSSNRVKGRGKQSTKKAPLKIFCLVRKSGWISWIFFFRPG